MRTVRLLALALGALLAPTAGCQSSRYSVEVGFAEGVDPSAVHFIELEVLRQCPIPTRVLGGFASDAPPVAELTLRQGDSPLPAIGSLASGTYGLYGRGFSSDCTAVVAGCTTVQVTDHGAEVLSLTLDPTAELSKCPQDGLCVDGACLVDASDACVTDPCPADSYCVDLADPAPVDASGRTCTPFTDCGPGQYQLAPPGPRTDRACASCQTCGANEIELVSCADGNTPQDRVCGLGQQVCTLVAAEDGDANASLIFAASGHGKTMKVTYDGIAPFYGFAQFHVASATCLEGGTIPPSAVIQSASIELTLEGGCYICGKGHALRRVTESWDESTVTVGLGPTVTNARSATFDAPDFGNPVVISSPELSGDVQEMLDTPGLDHGWRIEQVELPGNGLSPYAWATRESDAPESRPQLILTYQP